MEKQISDENKFAEENIKRVRETLEMLFLTTHKKELDEEEIIKEAEKHTMTEEEIKKAINNLLKENFIIDIGHRVFKKK